MFFHYTTNGNEHRYCFEYTRETIRVFNGYPYFVFQGFKDLVVYFLIMLQDAISARQYLKEDAMQSGFLVSFQLIEDFFFQFRPIVTFRYLANDTSICERVVILLGAFLAHDNKSCVHLATIDLLTYRILTFLLAFSIIYGGFQGLENHRVYLRVVILFEHDRDIPVSLQPREQSGGGSGV